MDDLMLTQWYPTQKVQHDAEEAARVSLHKHGPPTCNPTRAATILCEEAGEVAREALELTSRKLDRSCMQPARDKLLLLRAEAAQVAGYALLIMMQVDRGEYNIEPQ